MREIVGRVIVVAVAGYSIALLISALFTRQCEVCLKPGMFTARLVGYGRRIKVCWSCRKDLKRKKMIRPRGRPRRRNRHQTTRKP